jgi:hypothetical protein
MRKLTCFALLGAAVLLSGCSGATEAMGFGRKTPDEFAVVDRPPLSLPPTFDLRPPRPGAPRPQEVSMTNKAANTLFAGSSQSDFLSGGGQTDEAKSEGETALLASAGAAKADPNIRDVLDREAKQRAIGSDKLIDDILWWRAKNGETTVDAAAEAARLREAKEKGEDVTASKTPVISKGSSGWLGL